MRKNPEKSRQLLEQACEAHEKENFRKEALLLKKSAAFGSSEAQVNLGNLYSEGRGVKLSSDLAKSLYRSAFKRGCVYGATALGIQYKNEGKLKLAALWLNKAANMGEDWAQESLVEISALLSTMQKVRKERNS